MDRAPDQEPRRCFRSRGPEATRSLARGLAAAIGRGPRGSGLVISLSGEFGAGKTVFVKGLAEGLGIESTKVSSPTFVIANQYEAPGGRRLNHVDFYRLERDEELDTLGFDDLLDRTAVVAVEWGDRFEQALPRDRLVLRLRRGTASSGDDPADVAAEPPEAALSELRVIEARATGPDSARVLESWWDSEQRVGGSPES